MNRRDFLKLIGFGSATLASFDVIEALADPNLPSSLKAVATDERDPIFHVLNRVTFGPRPGQVDAVKKMGLKAYLEQQLQPEKIDDSGMVMRFADFISLDLHSSEIYAFQPDPDGVIQELESATILRAVYSQRDLFEVMVG